jgi:2-dehydropantoate 2-reductase
MEPEEKAGPADLVIFAVKYNGLEKAILDMKNQIGPNTIILSALNGISSEEIIGDAFGHEKVLYSVAQGMDGIRIGNKLTYKNMGMLCFGDREPGVISQKTKAVESFFLKTDFPHQVEVDMKRRMWGKLMLNVGVNQTVGVFRGSYGTIQENGEARDIMIGAMREVMAISMMEGAVQEERDLNYWLSVVDSLNPAGKPSMAQDIDEERMTEVDLFSGTVLALGLKHGIATPINQMLNERIKKLEKEFRI